MLQEKELWKPNIVEAVCTSASVNAPLMRLPINSDPRAMTAEECGADIRDTATSIVMATVFARKWEMTFCMSYAAHVSRCWIEGAGSLTLLAVAGGPACQLEIKLIEAMTLVLGGVPGKVAVEVGNGLSTQYTWQISRGAGKQKMMVDLRIYNLAEKVASGIEKVIHPYERHAKAPTLKRVAIVSCPLEDQRGKNANDLVNKSIGEMMGTMVKRCKDHGFAPEYSDDAAAWSAFFKKA